MFDFKVLDVVLALFAGLICAVALHHPVVGLIAWGVAIGGFVGLLRTHRFAFVKPADVVVSSGERTAGVLLAVAGGAAFAAYAVLRPSLDNMLIALVMGGTYFLVALIRPGEPPEGASR